MVVVLGGKVVLDHLSFTLDRGRFAGIIGPNGAGKTTLLRTLLGLVPITSGDARLFGAPVTRLGPVAVRIGYVPQHLELDRRFPATVRDVVMFGRVARLGVLRRPREQDRAQVQSSLEAVGLADAAAQPIGTLSGGQLQRASLARALAGEPELLLLDEPTSGLDLPAQDQFYDLLARLRAELRLTLMVVTHDLVAIASHADELLCVNQHLHAHGDTAHVLASGAVKEAYRCEYDFLVREPLPGRDPDGRPVDPHADVPAGSARGAAPHRH